MKFLMASCYLLGCILLLAGIAECSKILVIAGVSSRSHYNVFKPVIEELANRKHDVTVQTFYTLDTPKPNVKELMFKENPFQQNKDEMKQQFLNSLKQTPIGLLKFVYPFVKPMCRQYLEEETTKKLVAAGMQYDVVIVDVLFAECQTAVASLVGKHIINFYTSCVFTWKQTSAPAPPSYVPVLTDSMTSKMSFSKRLINTYNFVGLWYIQRYQLEPLAQEVLSELLPQAGTIEEVESRVVFSLTNADPVTYSARPTTPNIVNCGGVHLKEDKPLPKDLNDFVESSGDDGFIVFGLGSNMKSEFISPEAVQSILSAFSRLKQKVIWKFEAKLENLPKNVMITKWMPQQDLLAHPKARLFITHSGLLSLQEAIYHGVPVIGMPFFGDQRGNIARMKEIGAGEHFDFLNITADGFYEVITRVLNDKSYSENMKKYSLVFRDQPERPVDRAVFWIEYVIRHDGARHFRSAGEDLNFFQYFLLDVVAFVTSVLLIAVGLIAFLGKLMLRKLCGRKKSRKEFEKKTK